MFFQYIFDFLGELERRINNGDIKVEDILRLGGQAAIKKQPTTPSRSGSVMDDESANEISKQESEQVKKALFSV